MANEEPILLDFSNEKFIENLIHQEFLTDDQAYLKSAINFATKWSSNANVFEFTTSGSTGIPKINLFSRDQVIASIETTASYFNLKKGDNVFICLNTIYTGGKMMLARAMHLGLKVYIVAPSSFPFTDHGNNFYKLAAFVPSQFYTILNSTESESYLRQFQNVIIGGAAVNAELKSKCKRINYCNIYETFGMTETLSHVALKKLSDVSINQPFEALPGIEIDSDENNCLRIKAAVTNNKWIETKDVVEMITDEKFVWRGRFDNIINSGGIKINPEEIENAISAPLKSRGISEFYISSQEDQKLGQKLILVIEGEKTFHNIIEILQDILPEHHAPGKILYHKQFKRTKSGKIIRTI